MASLFFDITIDGEYTDVAWHQTKMLLAAASRNSQVFIYNEEVTVCGERGLSPGSVHAAWQRLDAWLVKHEKKAERETLSLLTTRHQRLRTLTSGKRLSPSWSDGTRVKSFSPSGGPTVSASSASTSL
jgi:hypothetical protein